MSIEDSLSLSIFFVIFVIFVAFVTEAIFVI